MTTQVRANESYDGQIFLLALSPFHFVCVCVCARRVRMPVCVSLLIWARNIRLTSGKAAHSFPYSMPKIAFSQRIFSFIIFIRSRCLFISIFRVFFSLRCRRRRRRYRCFLCDYSRVYKYVCVHLPRRCMLRINFDIYSTHLYY